jgi:ABC transporter substrate binding protein
MRRRLPLRLRLSHDGAGQDRARDPAAARRSGRGRAPVGRDRHHAHPQRLHAFSDLSNEDYGRSYFSVFKEGLEALGWADGRNTQIEYRWAAGDAARKRAMAAEMVGMGPDVILAMTTSALVALRQETRTIPLVFGMFPI